MIISLHKNATTLTSAPEAVAVELRRMLILPLDDLRAVWLSSGPQGRGPAVGFGRSGRGCRLAIKQEQHNPAHALHVAAMAGHPVTNDAQKGDDLPPGSALAHEM